MERHIADRGGTPLGGPSGLDTSVANIARMYDYWLGGRNNFKVDRTVADKLTMLVPDIKVWVHDNRAFLRRAVRFLSEQGVSQFLDVGTGLPTRDTVHEIAHETDPRARVAYVDYDPVVVSHGQALLAKASGSIVMRADVRDPGHLLNMPALREHLDFGRPIAVILVAVLHFVPDAADPAGIVATFREALPSGSYLVICHVTRDDITDDLLARGHTLWARATEDISPRSQDEVRRLFAGFELVEPGVVAEHAWRPVGEVPPRDLILSWAGIGRKP